MGVEVMGRLIYEKPYVDIPDRENISINRAFTYYIQDMRERQASPATIETYETHLKLFMEWLATRYIPSADSRARKKNPSAHVSYITRLIVQEYEEYCYQRGNSSNTVKSYVRSIRAFLYWCMDDDRKFIPTPYEIKLPRAETPAIIPYTEDEIERLIARPKSRDLTEWRNWAAVNTFLRTGLRLGSLCELKWSDVDFEKARLLVRKQKNKKQQYVPLAYEAINVLAEWQAISPTTIKGYIFFSTYTEDKIKERSLYQSIRKYNLKRGVEKTSIHLMRHTFGTIYLRKGGTSDKLKRILNHETREMTDRYVHLVAADIAQDIDKLTI